MSKKKVQEVDWELECVGPSLGACKIFPALEPIECNYFETAFRKDGNKQGWNRTL